MILQAHYETDSIFFSRDCSRKLTQDATKVWCPGFTVQLVLSWQLAQFPVTTCRPLMSFAAKRAKLQAMIILLLETRKVARSPKLRHQAPSRLIPLVIAVRVSTKFFL